MHNTIDSLNPARWVPTQLPAARPLPWREWLARFRAGRSRKPGYDELVELDAHTLADIGAPEALLARAMARRESHVQEHAGLYAGLASGAWRHW